MDKVTQAKEAVYSEKYVSGRVKALRKTLTEEEIVSLLRDENEFVRQAASAALSDLEPSEQGLKGLVQIAVKDYEFVSFFAVESIYELARSFERARQALEEVLNLAQEGERYYAYTLMLDSLDRYPLFKDILERTLRDETSYWIADRLERRYGIRIDYRAAECRRWGWYRDPDLDTTPAEPAQPDKGG